MTTEEEIEAITERLKVLKQIKSESDNERLNNSKRDFMVRADSLDDRYKNLYHAINNAVLAAGWKDFYFGVLNYQKHCIDSGYHFK